jgi:hypothetical protein
MAHLWDMFQPIPMGWALSCGGSAPLSAPGQYDCRKPAGAGAVYRAAASIFRRRTTQVKRARQILIVETIWTGELLTGLLQRRATTSSSRFASGGP